MDWIKKYKRLWFITILVIAFTGLCFSQNVPDYVPVQGLAGWWSFSGNADDASGNLNHGVVTGTVLTNDRFGAPNSAYEFDGMNDYIIIQDAPSLQINDEITLSSWCNVTKWYVNPLWGDQHFPVLCKSGNKNKFGKYSMTLMPKTGQAFLDGKGGKKTNLSTPVNQWLHYAVTIRNGVISFYMNGVLKGTQPVTDEIGVLSGVAQNDPLFIGTSIPGQTEWANGKLDDIGIWNRALSLQEIKNLYYSGVVCSHPDYEALMAMYYATGGENWKNNEGWKSGAEDSACDPCANNWYGVTCKNGRVVEIILEDNKLSGFLPEKMPDSLITLRISNNLLNGSIPDYSEFKKLQHLDISKNALIGTIPSNGFVNHVQIFNGSHNQLSGNIPPFTNPQLTKLDCSHNQLTGEIPEINSISNNLYIDFSHNLLSGELPEFPLYENLAFINFSNNNLSGCIPEVYCEVNNGIGEVNLSQNTLLPYQGNITLFCQDGISENAPCDDGRDYTNMDIIQPDCVCLGISNDSNYVSLDIENNVCGISGRETHVSVRVYQFKEINKLNFTIASMNESVAEIVGVDHIHPESGLQTIDFLVSDKNLLLSYEGASANLPDSAVLFTIRVRLNGPEGSKSSLVFKDAIQITGENNQDLVALAASGSVCVSKTFSTVSCISQAAAPKPPVVADDCGQTILPEGPFSGGTYNGCEGTITYSWTYKDCQSNEQEWLYTYFLSKSEITVTCTQQQVICSGDFFLPELQYMYPCSTAFEIAYDITGATVRSGSGTNASGVFNAGNSLLKWTLTTACDTAYCETSITALERVKKDTTVFACEAFTWNGTTYTQSGTYSFIRDNVQGCDTLENLILTIGKANSETLFITACEEYLWNDVLYTQSGIFTYTKANVSGCDSVSTLNLTILPSPCVDISGAKLNIDNTVCGGTDNIVCVPVRTFSFSSIAALQLSIYSEDNNVAEIVGICDVHPELEPSSIGFAIIDKELQLIYANQEITLPDSSVLFNIEVRLKDVQDAFTRLIFDQTINAQNFNFEKISVLGVSGSVCTRESSYSVLGKILNTASKGLQDVEVIAMLSTSTSKLDSTDALGQYTLEPLFGGVDYDILPRFKDSLLKGLNVTDLLILRRHLQGVSILSSPYLYVAGDINLNQQLDLGDLLYLQRLLSGTIDTLPGGKYAWRFIPKTYMFPSSGNPLSVLIPDRIQLSPLNSNQSGIDFIGVKYGDLDNSASYGGDSHAGSRGNGLKLHIAEVSGMPGQELEVDVRSDGFDRSLGMQFSLEWPQDKLELVGLPEGAGDMKSKGKTHVNVRDIVQGKVGILWESENVKGGLTMYGEGTCYRLRFRIREDATGEAYIRAAEGGVEPLFVDEDVKERKITIKEGAVHITPSVTRKEENKPIRIYPNPTTGILYIENGDSIQDVKIRTMDGRILTQDKRNKGTVDLSDLPAGVYWIQMQMDKATATKKIIVIK